MKIYWIEVIFTNGKTLRKDTQFLNDSYNVFCRYMRHSGSPSVQEIIAGFDDVTTGQWNLIEKIVV